MDRRGETAAAHAKKAGKMADRLGALKIGVRRRDGARKKGGREPCESAQKFFRNFVKKREIMLDIWGSILYYK